jgi:hypothetical protein
MEKEKKETNHAKTASVVHGEISKEKTALDENKQKLMDFRATPAFQEINPEHQQLLERQATAMDGYSQVLGQRISLLERDNPDLAPKPKAEPKSHKKEEA